MRALERFGLQVPYQLTKGEASWLFDKCTEYEAAFPTPATPRQKAYLQHHSLWRDGIGKREAGRMITQLKQSEVGAYG